MAKKDEKARVVEDVRDRLSRARSSVLADYRGLNVAESTELRRRLREAGIEFKIIKNTLMAIAAGEIGLDDIKAYLEGPTAVAFSYDDPTAAPRILSIFSKEAKKMEIKGGVLEGRIVGAEEMKRVADLPSREVLLGTVLQGAMSPLYGMASVMVAPLRNLAFATQALRELRESQA